MAEDKESLPMYLEGAARMTARDGRLDYEQIAFRLGMQLDLMSLYTTAMLLPLVTSALNDRPVDKVELASKFADFGKAWKAHSEQMLELLTATRGIRGGDDDDR